MIDVSNEDLDLVEEEGAEESRAGDDIEVLCGQALRLLYLVKEEEDNGSED